jgi:hypothetical protein
VQADCYAEFSEGETLSRKNLRYYTFINSKYFGGLSPGLNSSLKEPFVAVIVCEISLLSDLSTFAGMNARHHKEIDFSCSDIGNFSPG